MSTPTPTPTETWPLAGSITAVDVVLEAAVEAIEAAAGIGGGVRQVEELHRRFGFFLDEVDLEAPVERHMRQAHEAAALLDKLDRADRRAATQANRLLGMALTLDSVLVELREANRLARRTWWDRLCGAR